MLEENVAVDAGGVGECAVPLGDAAAAAALHIAISFILTYNRTPRKILRPVPVQGFKATKPGPSCFLFPLDRVLPTTRAGEVGVLLLPFF